MRLSKETRNRILNFQRNEITEHFIYKKLAETAGRNKRVLNRISKDELSHYNFWRKYTGKDVRPDRLGIWKYFILARLFGLTFGIKLMEKGEESAQATYAKMRIPGVRKIINDEDRHEKQLIGLINEERLRYVGSMVLGLNDALVELTGALAGLTLALQNSRLIAMAGLITGIAASMSMAASEYLSTKAEAGSKNPGKAALYTGSAYVITVILLILPFLLLSNLYFALGVTIFNAVVIIAIFNFYISIAQELPFRKRFFEMAFISLGIAALSFVIGFFIRIFLGV
jgi:VIT1/CCC1 family predicted Fe2+/Mn2+ transporter